MNPKNNDTFEHRPWGTFEILYSDEFCKIKRITVNPSEALSYQSHRYRKETWTAISGSGYVTLNGKDIPFSPGETVTIAPEQKHSVTADSNIPLIFIEVQTGSYFGEDDITRYSDRYGRKDI